MARIRTIRPEFPQSESMGRVSRDARLLFIQLWNICDDSGRTRGASRLLASLLFPYDEDALGLIDTWLQELETVGSVRRYVVDGTAYLDIPAFLDHQKIDKPTPSRLPAFRVDSPSPPRILAESSPLEGKGEEGNGREGRGVRLTPPSALMDAWNAGVSGGIPKCREFTDGRRKKAVTRLADAPLEEWQTVIARINSSRFCAGGNERGWVATFDWLLQPDTRVKVLEGKYDNRGRGQPAPLAAHSMGWWDDCKALHAGQCEDSNQHDIRVYRESQETLTDAHHMATTR